MLRSLALLVLTLQFRPVVVAAICLAGDSSAVEHCAMVAQTAGQKPHHQTAPAPPGHPTDCPAAQLCTTNASVLPAGLVLVTPQTVGDGSIAFWAPRLHVAEPTAPPVPPPNA
jgi:hypothetical protein